jgi:hypothetical protein
VYLNHLSTTPWGVPPWFYMVYLATKVPTVVLLAFVAGVTQIVIRHHERGSVFVRVFLVLTLLPMSLVATKFVRYLLPVFAVVDITAAVGIVWFLRWFTSEGRREFHACAAAVSAVLLLTAVVRTTATVEPYYGLHENDLGEVVSRAGLLFPHDELYDAGLREAVAAVATVASPDATVMSDAPEATRLYLDDHGRHDVTVTGLSSGPMPGPREETWALVQDGRRYFENATIIDQFRRRLEPFVEIDVQGRRAVQVFRAW